MKHRSFFNILIWVGISLCQVSGQRYELTSFCGNTVQTGGSCTLTCTTLTTQPALAWYDGAQGSYSQERSTCSSTSPSLPDGYTSACPTSTNFTISFNNASYNRDSKTWRCGSAFGPGSESSEVQIDVLVPLTSVSITRTSTSVTCVAVSNPQPSITLYRDGVNVATSPAAVEGTNGWTATLNHQLTGNQRNFVYWCQGSNTQITINSTVSYPQIAVTTVSLTNITSNNQEVGAAEGQSLTLTCVTSASIPEATVTWYKNNNLITSGVSHTTEITSGVAMITRSSLTLESLSKSDLGHQIHCRATNQYTTSQLQSYSARLGVWYGPEQVDINLPDNTAVIENRNLILTCTVTSYPAPTFTWQYTDGSSTGGSPGSVTSLPESRWSQTLTIRPNRNRQTIRCLASNPRTSVSQSTTISLDVKYPPDGSPSITQFKSTMFEGDTGERITCSVVGGNPLADIIWSCPETGTPSVSESGQLRTSSLTFTVTRGQNGQQCQCQGSWQYGGYDQSDVRMFNVSYPPSRPTLTLPPVVCEGQAVTSLGCSSTDPGNPPATYTWTKNSSPVSPGFSPVRSDDGATVRCSAGSIFTQRPGHSALQSDPRTLTVHYSPAIELPTTVTYKEGDTLSETCVSHSNPSTKDSDIRWMFHGAEIQQGARLLKSDVSRNDHGVYQCTATVNSQTCGQLQGVKNMSVVVNYAPNVSLVTADITEGETLTLTCQAEGRPVSYNFRSFTQFWGDTEIQTRVGDQTADTYTLKIDSASYTDSGVYECSVDNGVTDTSGRRVQRKRVSVSVKGRPKFTKDFKSRVGSEVGHDTTLYQTFYSQENCTYNWTFSGQSVGSNKTSSLTPAEVTLDVYGRTVQDSGWNVTLNIVNFQENNQGVYTVTVCNSLGCNSSGVNLTAAGAPLIPLDFHVINTTKSSIFLQWKRNFPGGDFIQVFLLHYRKLGDSDWKTLEREDNSNGFVSADVTGLQSGVKYEFKVRAVSNREIDNMSPYTDIITNQTLEVGTSNKFTGVIVGSIFGVVVICVSVAGMCVLYRKGYRCVRLAKGDQNSQASRNVEPSENTTYSSIDRRMEDSEYEKLENSPAQEYSQLRVYENFKKLSKDVAVYDGLQERKNLPYETVALHQYENINHKKEDPAYANTKESFAT